MLHIEAVAKSYQAHGKAAAVDALAPITLTIERGEFLSIIGPSGCGKSTLLDIIAGLEPCSSGSVTIENEVVTGPHPDVGVVFQEDATFPWLTNLQNVEFALQRSKLPRKEKTRRALEALELVGVAEFSQHNPQQLSGGMRQRVNIARVLSARPQILLMDEPFGALDEQTRITLGDELLRIWRATKTTIVFVTHSLSEAALLSDRIAVMSARPGTVKEVVRSPLPKTRTSAVLGSADFATLTGRLWQELSGAPQIGAAT